MCVFVIRGVDDQGSVVVGLAWTGLKVGRIVVKVCRHPHVYVGVCVRAVDG